MKTTIPLTGRDVWVAERTPTALGDLSGLEIAKHIFDARHFSKITSFEYHRKRGTRNTMDPAPPAFGTPRGPTSATAQWLHETLIVTVDCEGQDAGDDRVIVALLPEGRVSWEFDCSKAGDLRLVKNRDAGSAEPASAEVTERDDGWSVVFTVPWAMLGLHPRPGFELPFNVVRKKDWADVEPPEMLPGGYLVNGQEPLSAGLEVCTLSRKVRYPDMTEPTTEEGLGRLVLSPALEIRKVQLHDCGLTTKELQLELQPTCKVPERIDALITVTDPYGCEVRIAEQVSSTGQSTVEFQYLFGADRGFLYPYRIEVILSDPDSGTCLAARSFSFQPESVRLDPLQRGHEQRGSGRFRLAGPQVAGSEWRIELVADTDKGADRGRLKADSDETFFEVNIGEVPRGRYRLRLTIAGLNPVCCVQCPCNVMGRRPCPSILLNPADVERLRKDVRRPGGLRPHYERMKQDVDALAERGTISERSWVPTGTEWHDFAIDEILSGDMLLLQGFGADTIPQRNPHLMMAAALVYLIEGDAKYGALAKRLVRVLVDHTLWGDPRVHGTDLDCSWKAAFCAIVMDWLDDLFEPDERRVLRDQIVHNGMLVYLWPFEYEPHIWKGLIDNGVPVCSGIGAALALMLRDEVLDAEQILVTAHDVVQPAMRAFPPEGSWPESVNYWGVFVSGLVFYGAVLESGMGMDDGVFSMPGMRRAGYFPMYFTPRGVPAGFNDGMVAAAAPLLHLLAKKYDEPLFSFYADAYAGTVSDESNPQSEWYTVMWRSAEFEYVLPAEQTEIGDLPAPPVLAAAMNLNTLQVYEEIRWAALADSWPHPELYVSFKSGYAIHGIGHVSLDLNAIQVVAGGEPLIRRSHNYQPPPQGYSTILIDGEPQQHETGTFIYWRESERFRCIAAEADRSFGSKVEKVRRHLVMVDGCYLVVIDEVIASQPVCVTFMAHTAGELELSEGRSRIKGLQTNLSVSFVSPAVEQSCVDPPICVREQLTQRVLHATTAPASEIELVTVVWPERGEGGQPICEWTDATLTVKRPDSACDCLIFERTPEGLKFMDLN